MSYSKMVDIAARDWVLLRDLRGVRVVVIEDRDHAASLQGAAIVQEVRKADGSIWRRRPESGR